MLKAMGIKSPTNCNCGMHAAQMNVWGVDGCRKHRHVIVAWLTEAWASVGLGAILLAAPRALLLGINPVDPIGCLVDRAIAKAEAATQDGEG